MGEIRGPYSPFLCGRLSTASQEGTGDKEAAHLEGGAAHIRGIVEETHQRSDPNYDGRAVTTTERQQRENRLREQRKEEGESCRRGLQVQKEEEEKRGQKEQGERKRKRNRRAKKGQQQGEETREERGGRELPVRQGRGSLEEDKQQPRDIQERETGARTQSAEADLTTPGTAERQEAGDAIPERVGTAQKPVIIAEEGSGDRAMSAKAAAGATRNTASTETLMPNERERELEERRLRYLQAIQEASPLRIWQGGLPTPIPGRDTTQSLERLFFRWWKNSCWYHTFLEGIIFPIIEAGGETVFQKTVFGQTLVEAYKYSREESKKHHVSSWLRQLLCGENTEDQLSVQKGKGAGTGPDKDTKCSLIMPISGVFDTLENEETAPRFTRNDDSNTRFKLRYT